VHTSLTRSPRDRDPRVIGRSSHEDFVVTKDLDHLSPHLLSACAAGERLAEVVVRVLRTTSAPDQAPQDLPWFRFLLRNVVLTSVLTSVEEHGPLETVAMSYAEIGWFFEGEGAAEERAWVVHGPTS
jgi:type VI secretion system Hcp family effector